MNVIAHIERGVRTPPNEHGPAAGSRDSHWAKWKLENASLVARKDIVIFIEEGSFGGHTCVFVYDTIPSKDSEEGVNPFRCFYVAEAGQESAPKGIVKHRLNTFVEVVQAVVQCLEGRLAEDESLGKGGRLDKEKEKASANA